jgi:hypothetical protein
VAVGVNGYNGDILEPGKYKAHVKYTRAGTAEIFDIVVSNRELSANESISIIRDAYSESYKSNVESEYSHYTTGVNQNTATTMSLSKGQYVHIIPNTYYYTKRGLGFGGKVYGLLSLNKIQ